MRENRKPTVSSSELNKLPALLQNIKNLKAEKSKLQELVSALKQSNEELEDQHTRKLQAQKQKLQRAQAQCSNLLVERQAFQALLQELRKHDLVKRD